jgi:hypothetical protein
MSWPASGKYAGWFLLKQPPPKNPAKIDDRELHLHFEKQEHGYSVNGYGVNKFGKFKMAGTMTDDGDMEIYRTYEVKKVPQSRGGKRGKRVGSHSQTVVPSPLTKRQSRGTWKDKAGAYEESELDEFESDPVEGSPESTFAKPRRSSLLENADRPKRMSEHMKRCSDILKHLQKHAHAIWFRDPVDPIKLGIPDYFDVIKEPMDFSTIQFNLDSQLYETPEGFAEHMRLVFRNAVTYNTLRTSAVHIAARELSEQFETKYRMMISQLGSSGIDTWASRKGKAKNKARSSYPPGPVPMEATQVAQTDPNTLAEMQRRMEEMQQTIYRLQTEMKTKDIKPYAEPAPG